MIVVRNIQIFEKVFDILSILEAHCDRLTSDDRFFSNLFRLLTTIEQSTLTSEDRFDAIALVFCVFSV